jgi:hypothetical protein
MKIEDIVDNMTSYLEDGSVQDIPWPCSEDEITIAESQFKNEFGYSFPEAYKRVLRRANGVMHNGLIIWPAKPQAIFQETIFQVNINFRDSFSDEYLYFAQMDEELYVFNINTQEYCAIEFVGKPVWKQFVSADEMFLFVLERAWE